MTAVGAGAADAGAVLIVDDDPDLRDLLFDLALDRGYRVEVAASAREALALAAARLPDVVVTDVQMDEMDGLELCRRLAARWPELPVVVMTAADDLDTTVSAIHAGAFEVVTKPIARGSFLVALARAVAHRRAPATGDHLR